MHDTECLGLVHWDDPEGWDGEGDGRGFRMGKGRNWGSERSSDLPRDTQQVVAR